MQQQKQIPNTTKVNERGDKNKKWAILIIKFEELYPWQRSSKKDKNETEKKRSKIIR